MITNKHWTFLYFQMETLEIIMKQLGLEVTIDPNFAEIRKQSLDNYFETYLMKPCDVTTFYLKEWKIKWEEEPSVWRKVSRPSVNLTMNHSSGQCWVKGYLGLTAECPLHKHRHPVPAKPVLVSTSLYGQWKCNHKCSPPKVYDSSIPETACGQQSPAFVHPTFPSPSANTLQPLLAPQRQVKIAEMLDYRADSHNQRHQSAATNIKYFTNLVSFCPSYGLSPLSSSTASPSTTNP